MSRPRIYGEDIKGAGTNGYLSVRLDSPSKRILETMVEEGKAERDEKAEDMFANTYCVRFPSHFSDHVEALVEYL